MKKELTKEQLKECEQVWIEVKNAYLTGQFNGLCVALEIVLLRGVSYEFNDILTDSLKKYKPKGKRQGGYWWSQHDTNSRLEVLNKLIQEFSPH